MSDSIDREHIEQQIREGLDNFIEMATDDELMVLGNLFELQLRKAVFLRGAHNLCSNEDDLATFYSEFIQEYEADVMGMKQRLDKHYQADMGTTLKPH